ncbi:MAG: hypothetical protein ACFE8J_13180, partial [Candidatus Heimdallarchaeota archaeon]
MIICSNCGATNNEAETHICRKCGALLPISSKPPRIRLTSAKDTKKKSKSKKVIPKEEIKKPVQIELQEIPKQDISDNETQTHSHSFESAEFKLDQEEIETEYDDLEDEKEVLQEIAPKPFKGSIISSKAVYGQPVKLSKKGLEKDGSSIEVSLLKQKQLEEDMTKVLKFLSNK